MRCLVFDITNQTLKQNSKCDFENIVRATDKYLAIKLNCPVEWKRANKVITIKNTDNVEFYIPYYDVPVYLDEEMTKGSIFGIKVTGKTNGGATMQTNTIYVMQTE